MKQLFFFAVSWLIFPSLSAQKVIGEKVIGEKNQASQSNTSKDTVVQVMPSTVGPYAPKKLLGGDREFDGHGPEIWAWVKLDIVDKKYINATVYMHARETVSDWSETEGTWTKRLYTAPAGYEITGIMSGKYSEVHYISKPGVKSFTPAGLTQAVGGAKGIDVPFKDDGLVTRWNIVGDTGGTDISEDNNPHDDTQVAVQLNPVKLKLKKLPTVKSSSVGEIKPQHQQAKQ
jgi:hypothetical protein